MESEYSGFLIAYDVRCPKRLVGLHRFLAARALAVQYSVFAGHGDFRWAARLAAELRQRIDARQDDVRIYSTPQQARIFLVDAARGHREVILAGADLPRLLRELLGTPHATRPFLI